MLRRLATITLLLASIFAPASAMDQSAMEETNCLMACDANQEHCGAGQFSGKNHSPAAFSSHREMKSSAAISSRRPIGVSATYEETLSRPVQAKR